MKAVAVLESAAISALGRGNAATALGSAGEAPRLGLRLEPTLGLAMAHPLVGRAELEAEHADRATALLVAVATDLAAALDARFPAWRSLRLRVLVGTSAGPMNAASCAFAAQAEGRLTPELAGLTPYFSPLAALEAALGVEVRAEQILGACASATLAIGLGCRSLDAGDAELVIAGGYDALSAFVGAGFDALGALTRGAPNPFRASRDGMALGEGAALLALAHAEPNARARGYVLGFGASSDAVHGTAPDREGRGVAEAGSLALADAGLGPELVDFVSAHATSTPYNDAAEARALSSLFPGRCVPVHAFKAQIGHTLGAAGALESLAVLDALASGVFPATAGSGSSDEGLGVELAAINASRPARAALKLSSAFGGLNAALVLSSAPGAAGPRPRRAVHFRAQGRPMHAGDPELVRRVASGKPDLAQRADELGELVLAAAAELLRGLGRPFDRRTAVVVATAYATLEQNARFEARRRQGRPVEPRRFPNTSPSACAGLCAIVFGLRGPSFSVGSGDAAADAAWVVAYDLVAAADVEEVLVVAAEDIGPVGSAVLAAAGCSVPTRGAAAVLLSAEPFGAPIGRGSVEPPWLRPANWLASTPGGPSSAISS